MFYIPPITYIEVIGNVAADVGEKGKLTYKKGFELRQFSTKALQSLQNKIVATEPS